MQPRAISHHLADTQILVSINKHKLTLFNSLIVSLYIGKYVTEPIAISRSAISHHWLMILGNHQNHITVFLFSLKVTLLAAVFQIMEIKFQKI